MNLISLKNINNYYTEGQNTLTLSLGQIITPSAKDFLKNKGVKLVYNNSKQEVLKKNDKNIAKVSSSNNLVEKELVERITYLLVNRYGICDVTLLNQLVLRIISEINK